MGTVGGQAVMEGVMMKSRQGVATAVRRFDGEIVVRTGSSKSLKDKYKILKLPLIRGIVNFIEMMALSFSTLTSSAEMLGLEEEEPGKFGKWLEKHFGKSVMSFVSLIGTVLGVGLALVLFIWLPAFVSKLISRYIINLGNWYSLVEGFIKMIIFISYLLLVSLIPDIKRVFAYHGAEHKSIFCYEAGEELTVENIRTKSRFHPRCGTSFIFVLLIISILIGAVLPSKIVWLRVVLKVLLLPLVVGIGYEYIIYVGKHENGLTRILSAPGLLMQRITTKEPDDTMIEVAVVAVKSALREEFPDFVVPYENQREKAETNETNTQENKTEESTTEENVI
ncbi:MAG: DUF1385 domain-containing protein [Clostridiales bacterium]|nr:DUF1385 domain-containing protein [Clostridiales bacterium]